MYSNSLKKKNSTGDAILLEFAIGSENCRRQTLIRGMGGSDFARPMERCCDVCTPQAIMSHDRLNVLEIGKALRKKKRVAVRVVSKELSQTLMAERDKYVEENPCCHSIGANFVCPDVTIDELCSQAEYIQSSSDITLFGVRSDLKHRFLKIISSVLTQMVSRKRHRHI